MTYEELKRVNDEMITIPIHDKDYATVNERVKAFRKLLPNGGITTDIYKLENGVVVVKATVIDEDGRVLGTGMAREVQGDDFINKKSFLENCETSAVGRALGFAGFGVDESIASADEMTNAIMNQEAKVAKIDKKAQKVLEEMVIKRGYTVKEIFPKGLELTADEYAQAVRILEKAKNKGEK